MQKLALATHSTMAFVLAGAMIACDKGPTGPSVPIPPAAGLARAGQPDDL